MDGEAVSVEDVAEYLDIDKKSVYRKVKKHDGLKTEGGYIEKVETDNSNNP